MTQSCDIYDLTAPTILYVWLVILSSGSNLMKPLSLSAGAGLTLAHTYIAPKPYLIMENMREMRPCSHLLAIVGERTYETLSLLSHMDLRLTTFSLTLYYISRALDTFYSSVCTLLEYFMWFTTKKNNYKILGRWMPHFECGRVPLNFFC